MLYFADVPTDMLFIPFLLDGGMPAADVPQYWHRAARLEEMFIAHAESRQRVRFAWEHLDTACAFVHSSVTDNKNISCVFIFSLVGNYTKIKRHKQKKKFKSCIDKKRSFVYNNVCKQK